MNERPRLKLETTKFDNTIEFLSWTIIISIWTLTIANYNNLPDIIPTHYNFEGKVDGYGNKATILTLPFIATVLLLGITYLNKFPHIFNYSTIITADNALQQYTAATRMLRFLKLAIAIIFLIIIWQTINYSQGKSDGIGIWQLPIIIAIIFVPIVYYLYSTSKASKQ